MSLDADALAEMAQNRGLKLVRSRVRTPGKPGFGRFALTDARGKPVFGMEGKALTADADAIAAYLRGSEASGWKASLKSVGGRRKAKPSPSPFREVPPKAAEGSRVGQDPDPSVGFVDISPKGETPPELREAKPADAPQLARLFAHLDHEIAPAAVRRNLTALAKADEPMLVAARGKRLLGVCAIHRTINPHREKPVGRVTILVVAEEARDQGLGRRLMEEAERRLAALGCRLIEVTSNDRLRDAHAFYRHLGYERTSMRFAKPLPNG